MSEHGSPDPTAAAPSARVIALMNQKGGVGKTTTTVNLGAGLATLGKRVLVVDLDPQAHATLHLGLDPAGVARSVYDLMLDWDDGAEGTVVKIGDNLSLVPSETDLAAAESELATGADRHRRLARALAPLKSSFDFILIDCPPSLGMLTINGLAAADQVIIPMQAHFLALQGVGKLIETVRLVQAKLNPGLTVGGVILCMHDAQSTHTQEVVADIENYFEAARAQDVPWRHARVFRPAIRRNIKLAECPSFGKTIFDYAPQAPGAADYRALAESVLAAQAPEPPSPTPEVIVTTGSRSAAGAPA